MDDAKKPFDLKELAQELKEKGLPDLELCCRDIIEAFFEWTEKSIGLSENKVDDVALAVLPYLKKYILEKVDEVSASQATKP